ncbi:unnamed protein product [Macrosiphum euphorbiae]|uniref:MULE transposase domain-containing protein n=1 Tax=Macrosiphum euphorbiae TaxID=13131 RepID=A0AAV0WJK1_9HEMI|nr:unnamed protein product [Macrosiphum euphorbiae]
MLQIIIHKCAERNLFPYPQIINVDFEKAVINAIKTVIGEDVQIQGCFFHLCRSTHRKIQQLGLEQLYRLNEEFSHFCGMLDSLAFLPIYDINTGLNYLKSVMPEEATDLVEYFERTYVNHKHPTIWTLITKMRHENAADETKVAQRQLGTIGPPLKKKKYMLSNLCEGYNDGSRDIPNFLNAIANFIRN